MSGKSKPKNPIIFTARADVGDAVRQELKALGAENCTLVATKEEAVKALIDDVGALLVIDWDLGSEIVNATLGATRGHFKVETRPICLIIPELEANVIAAGAEYGVSQMHAGPVSRNSIKDCLIALMKEDASTTEIRDVLVQVATARSKGDWAIATPLLQNLNERQPGQERVVIELAENLIYEEAWDEALGLLKPFVDEQAPPNVRALHLMGRCFMRRGDFDNAIGYLSKAKIINPHNVERLIDLGNSFLNNDQLKEARENFSEAMTLDEDNKDAKIGAGTVMMMSGEVNEALGLLKTVSGPRELASVFNTSAILSMHQGRYTEGMKLYNSALAALGRDDRIAARLLFNMGLGYKRWHKIDKALVCFEKSVKLDGTYAKAAKYRDQMLKAKTQMPPVAAVVGEPAPPDGGQGDGAFAEEEFTKGALKPAAPLVADLGDDVGISHDDFEVDD